MNPLCDVNYIRHLMKKYKLQFNKKYGQNFLTDEQVLDDIISTSGITPDDGALEIGPGLGTLTFALAQAAKHVVAVEIDRGLAAVLEDTLAEFDTVTVLHQDILKTDIGALVAQQFDGRAPYVVANLPYYITTPIIMGLLESGIPFPAIVVMIQKEVAQRMMAFPGGKEYGVLSIAVQFYADAEICLSVPRGCFIPAPNVDSAVIRLTPRPHPTCRPKDPDLFFKVIRAAFGQRRKTLLNAMSNAGCFPASKQQMEEILLELGMNPAARGETLSMEQFAQLSDALSEGQNPQK